MIAHDTDTEIANIYYRFYIEKKKFEGLLEIFFVCKHLLIVQTVRIHLSKILNFFFSYTFLGVRQTEFWLVQSN